MSVHVKYHLYNACALGYFVFSLLIFGISGNTPVVFKQFKSQPDYFQATCQEGDNVLSEETRSLTECLVLCAQTTSCYTALYNQPQCRGCAIFYVSTEPITEGTIHYQWTSACGNGWFSWTQSCYKISEPGTFQQGQAYCADIGATAVTVETESENEFLKQMVESLEESFADPDTSVLVFFLGITDDCTGNGEWRQTADGEMITFQDFAIGEPTSPTMECCVALYQMFEYRWVDISCSGQFRTICEKHLL